MSKCEAIQATVSSSNLRNSVTCTRQVFARERKQNDKRNHVLGPNPRLPKLLCLARFQPLVVREHIFGIISVGGMQQKRSLERSLERCRFLRSQKNEIPKRNNI